VDEALASHPTTDVGGSATTKEFADAVLARLEATVTAGSRA